MQNENEKETPTVKYYGKKLYWVTLLIADWLSPDENKIAECRYEDIEEKDG